MDDKYFEPYKYEIVLDPTHKWIDGMYHSFWDGKERIHDWNIFQVVSTEMLTLNELREKLAGTTKIKSVSGEFKDIVTIKF